MKKFNFELDKVLEFRDFEKKQAESELAKALAVETEIQNNLNLIAQQYAISKQNLKGSLSFEDMLSQSQFSKLLELQKEELLKQLTEAKMVSEEKRKILTECMKKTTALEKMKEQQFEAYKEEIKMEENKRAEELSTIKANSDYLK